MKKTIIISLILFSFSTSQAQKRNAVWCFGDSSGIDFNITSNPAAITTALRTRGSCASICDTSGQLLFYSNTRANIPGNTTLVYSHNNLLMQNGDSIVGRGWYQELVITDFVNTTSQYYLFSIGATSIYGFYYSVVDMSLNGGLGEVIQKNVQLENFQIVDGMRAIKHGNGRDWWISIRNAATFNNSHYLYLVTPSGVSPAFIQQVGSINSTNTGRYAFSHDGSKLAFINYIGLMELYDFDRCTGMISNPLTIHPQPPLSGTFNYFWSAEFSPNDRFLYVSAYDDTCYLYQYDMLSSNPASTRVTLDVITNDLIGIGNLKLAPDGKIYLSNNWECPWLNCYPYPDSVYNNVNMNLSVINYPDSLGTACGYAPYSFYLGGKRTYNGLPNNPDYDMPALAGSPCDTLTGLTPGPLPKERGAELFVTWIGSWQKLFVNAQGLKGRNVTVEVFDKLGKVISASPPAPLPEERGEVHNGYFTQDIFLPNLSAGVCIVRLKTEKEVLAKKFVKE